MMTKIHFYIIFVYTTVFLIMVCIVFYKPVSYDGTYSLGKEPSDANIIMTFKNDEITLYNQQKILARGEIVKLDNCRQQNIYKFISQDKLDLGYVLFYRNNILLLGFQDTELLFGKISNSLIQFSGNNLLIK